MMTGGMGGGMAGPGMGYGAPMGGGYGMSQGMGGGYGMSQGMGGPPGMGGMGMGMGGMGMGMGMGGTGMGMGGQPGMPGQLPPGQEMPTPAPLPDVQDQPNQGLILAAILGGSAILGIALGCAMFRKKGGADGDSDEDMDSDDDDESDES